MSDSIDQKVEQVERDRKKRETELLLLLLLLTDDSRRHARYAIKVGISPSAAADQVILGNPATDQPGGRTGVSLAMQDAYSAGVKRVFRWSKLPYVAGAGMSDLTEQYYVSKANTVIKALSDQVRPRIEQAVLESANQGIAKTIRAVNKSLEDGGLSHQNESYLALATEQAIVSAYNEGMYAAYQSPLIKNSLRGFRHVSIVDSSTTTICLERDAFVRSISDPYWLTNWCPLHFNAIMEGSTITTSVGEKPIENIRIGDLVLTHRGRFMPVTAVMSKRFDGNIRTFKSDSGGILRTTDEHPICTSARGWVRADALRRGDKLFQHSEKPIEGSSSIFNAVPDYYPSLFNENFVPDQVSFLSPIGLMPFSINFQSYFVGKSEVQNKATGRFLKFVKNIRENKFIQNFFFSPRRILSLCFRPVLAHFDSCFEIMCRVLDFHSFGVSASPFLRCLGSEPSSLLSMEFRNRGFGHYGSGFSVGSNGNAISFADAVQGRNSESILDLQFSNRGHRAVKMFVENNLSNLFNGWKHSTIISVADKKESGHVFNFSVAEDETYAVGGVLVHNCRSAVFGVFADEWDGDQGSYPTTPPMEGFGTAPAFVQSLWN